MSKQKSNLNLCSLIALFHFILVFTSPLFFSCVLRDSTPHFVGPSVRPLVRHTLLFRRLWGFWPCCSCLNAPLTSIMAPAHPHATRAAVYPALFYEIPTLFILFKHRSHFIWAYPIKNYWYFDNTFKIKKIPPPPKKQKIPFNTCYKIWLLLLKIKKAQTLVNRKRYQHY